MRGNVYRGARRPTMKEVARVAGVSLATVSRVVNGTGDVRAGSGRARPTTPCSMLGYRRDLTASTLRRADRQSASIGLIIEDVSNPFFSAVHRGVEDVARPHGVLTFVGSSDEQPERERELAEAFGARGVDGLVIVPCAPDQSYLMRDHQRRHRAGVRRPPAALHARRRRGRRDNVGGARARRRAPARRRPPPDRVPRRPAGRLHRAASARPATARRSAAGSPDPDSSAPSCSTASSPYAADARAAAGRRPADGALHRPEPDHDRRDPRAARARPASARSRWSASTTSRSATSSIRASPSSPRTRTRSAATPASCCSRREADAAPRGRPDAADRARLGRNSSPSLSRGGRHGPVRSCPVTAKRPTMKDVAAVAGVSLSTVSRVVNGSPPVAPELAEKVEPRGRDARLPAQPRRRHAAPRERALALARADLRRRRQPVLRRHPPRRRGGRAHARRGHVRGQLGQ